MGAGKTIELDLPNAAGSTTSVWNNTAPTSSVVHIGTHSGTNASSGTYVAYCFEEKEGYSKFGSYTGNGSSEGPFIYLGFRPAFVLFKRSDAVNSWMLIDNKREGYNPQNDLLFPDDTAGESDVTDQDLLSNGFKLRTSGVGRNASGSVYIYAAFAEQPFKYSNGR